MELGNGESLRDYFVRLEQRMQKAAGIEQRLSQVLFIARTGENHFKRIEFPKRRHARAFLNKDPLSADYETQCLLALMYEIADTSYLVLHLLDFDGLELQSSADGLGLAGDSAPGVIQILRTLDNQCARLLALEKEFKLPLDFSEAVDEREGITYQSFRHWQDYTIESVKQSFFKYFARAQQSVAERMEQKPAFWARQTVGNYLQSKGYGGLVQVAFKLLRARFEA